MKYLALCFALLLFSSCSKDYTSVDEYMAYPVKYAKINISDPTNDFALSIPKSWFWKTEQYETKAILFGIVAGSSDTTSGYTRILSVEKNKSDEANADLEKEYNASMKRFEGHPNLKVVESGATQLSNYKAYFIHTKSVTDNSIETISYIVKGKEKNTFYSLTASCQLQDGLKQNMAMMIQSLNSFKYN
ncbi:MAG: hypothetical protein QM710_13905 [Flavobacterium sp.]